MENIPENNNSNQENEKDTANPGTKKKKYSKGFYVALAFCLLAWGPPRGRPTAACPTI